LYVKSDTSSATARKQQKSAGSSSSSGNRKPGSFQRAHVNVEYEVENEDEEDVLEREAISQKNKAVTDNMAFNF
jgi:hypothetical protein